MPLLTSLLSLFEVQCRNQRHDHDRNLNRILNLNNENKWGIGQPTERDPQFYPNLNLLLLYE